MEHTITVRIKINGIATRSDARNLIDTVIDQGVFASEEDIPPDAIIEWLFPDPEDANSDQEDDA